MPTPERFVGRVERELHRGVALDHHPEAERVADQAHVDLRDLHAALRNRADEPVRLEARDELADRAERHPGDLGELALRDELAGADLPLEEAAREALVGLVAQLHAGATLRGHRWRVGSASNAAASAARAAESAGTSGGATARYASSRKRCATSALTPGVTG